MTLWPLLARRAINALPIPPVPPVTITQRSQSVMSPCPQSFLLGAPWALICGVLQIKEIRIGDVGAGRPTKAEKMASSSAFRGDGRGPFRGEHSGFACGGLSQADDHTCR